ncbi:hypothetical protein [Serratia ureilytica]|uniref:hypothetical protein n=1 Tax=Serratia ureilytica TaxID=300181 RepID=UPI001EF7687A|nr:hypothetical protein [Serratia marcescens]
MRDEVYSLIVDFQPQRDARVFVEEALQRRHQIMGGEFGRGGDAQFTDQLAAQRGDPLLPALGGVDHQQTIFIKAQSGFGQAQ